jgi:RNA polymerase sigma-70 factor, ECF subfamily
VSALTEPALGTRAELEVLYRERFYEFVRVATAIVGDETAAVDVVQEAFARALSALPTYRGEGPLAAWVWRILINNARTQARQVEIPVDQIHANGTATSDEIGEETRRWLALLSERQRIAVFLRYYADLDYRGIAEALQVEVGTVSATLSAAHDRLRSLIKERTR